MLRRLCAWFARVVLRDRSNPFPEWVDVPRIDPWNDVNHIQHDFEHVSRHAIAETGLLCPRCGTLTCPQGDYSLVKRSARGEVVKCQGKREINDEEMVCNAWLFASPDTEHGDHLAWDQMPAAERERHFYRFVRISSREVIERQYDKNVQEKDGSLIATGEVPTAVERPKIIYHFFADQTFLTTNGRFFKITRVVESDPYYKGWAWGVFDNDDASGEWHVDPQGLIHSDMRDPTMTNTIRLKSQTVLIS